MPENKIQQHEFYMHRCFELAKNGLGKTAPNPMVGSVIVYKGQIIGEGFHQLCGQAHAEVNAINSVSDKALLKESTLYVNLEPCSHYGKTPPCADLIVQMEIPKVVICNKDPFPEVAGRGIKRLQDNGIKVTVGILEAEGYELNKRFFTFHTQKRPYIILKWAETLDNYMDLDRSQGEDAHINWITAYESKMLVHKWRSEEQAIMVGKMTAINDNPSLNVREWAGDNPLRIVLDTDNELPADLKLLDGSIPTVKYCFKKNPEHSKVEQIELDPDENILNQIMSDLYKRNIQSLFVEGGKQLLNSFLDTQIWDEARVFIGKKLFHKGLKAPHMPEHPIAEEWIGNDLLLYFKNSKH